MALLIKSGRERERPAPWSTPGLRVVRGGRGGSGFGAGDSVGERIAQSFRRGSQMPSANAVPNQSALHGASEHGFDKVHRIPRRQRRRPDRQRRWRRTPLDVARGAGGVRGGADAFPKTVALLESLMKAKGIQVAAVPSRQEK